VLSSPNNNTVIAFPLPLDVRGIVPQGPVLGEAAPAAPIARPDGEAPTAADGNGASPAGDST